jgi:hypothetical protein
VDYAEMSVGELTEWYLRRCSLEPRGLRPRGPANVESSSQSSSWARIEATMLDYSETFASELTEWYLRRCFLDHRGLWPRGLVRVRPLLEGGVLCFPLLGASSRKEARRESK